MLFLKQFFSLLNAWNQFNPLAASVVVSWSVCLAVVQFKEVILSKITTVLSKFVRKAVDFQLSV